MRPFPHIVRGLAACAVVALCAPAQADEAELSTRAEVGVESRAFYPDGKGGSKDYNIAPVARLEVRAEKSVVSARGRALVRHDMVDDERSVVIGEEAWLGLTVERLELKAGLQTLTWSATEAFHPADVVNSRYFDSSIETPDKLGEPMVSASIRLWSGSQLTLMYMPVFMKPVLPSRRSRYNLFGPGVTPPPITHLDRNGRDESGLLAHQGALRFTQTVGGADLGLHVMQHVERFAPIVAPRLNEPVPTLALVYLPTLEAGLTYLHVAGPVVIKAEGTYRHYLAEKSRVFGELPELDHGLLAVGLEYGLSHESGSDSTFLLEGMQAFLVGEDARAVRPLFDHDLMVGYRLAFNDEQGKALLVTAVIDAVRPEQFFANVLYSQRLTERWSADGGVRIARVPPRGQGQPTVFEWLNNAHQAFVNLKAYF